MYSKSIIESLYYNDYLNVLKCFKQGWVDIKTLIPRPYYKYTVPWVNKSDLYLREYADNKVGLALDILENGTYWPLVVCSGENGKIYLTEGFHRVESIKLAIEQGLWTKDTRMLAIYLPSIDLYDYRGNKNVLNKFKLKYPIKIPVFTSGPKTPFRFFYLFEKFGDKAVDLVDKLMDIKGVSRLEITTDSWWILFKTYQLYTTELRDMFYRYKEKNKEIIKPNLIINDYDEWYEWYREAHIDC